MTDSNRRQRVNSKRSSLEKETIATCYCRESWKIEPL